MSTPPKNAPPPFDHAWERQGSLQSGSQDDVRDLIWRQLNRRKKVLLTGHSKGGAVATTAASRLVLGDGVSGNKTSDPRAKGLKQIKSSQSAPPLVRAGRYRL